MLQKATGTSPDAKAQSVLGNVVYGNESGYRFVLLFIRCDYKN